MRVKDLTIKNFRIIDNLEISFGELQTTVFVGINGCGKTSILDCVAILLSRLIGRIESDKGTGRFFNDLDITNGCTETVNKITISFKNENSSYRVTKTRKGREKKKQTITNLTEIKSLVKNVRKDLDNDPHSSIPLAVYYPVNRAVLDIPLRIRQRHVFDQLAAYVGALTGVQTEFRVFFEWFRDREDLENELRLDNKETVDPHLEAVRKAVASLIPGFSKLRIKRNPLRMTLEKNGKELIVNQLSDGEKCLLALAGDLARRLAIANPSYTDPLKGHAVVIIDEIELHLHPGWQRKVIPSLEKTFPNCQFIITTHSPQVLSHIRPDGVYILKPTNKGILLDRPSSTYGRDTNLILEEIMEVPARPDNIKKMLKKYFNLIDLNNFEKANQLRKEIEDLIGTDEPELIKADILIKRKRLLKK